MKRHGVEEFYILGEGVVGLTKERTPVVRSASRAEQATRFRFSRMRPLTDPDDVVRPSEPLLEKLAAAMVKAGAEGGDGHVPAGFTYLGQFIDHDLTRDDTELPLGAEVAVEEMQQGRSPSLDLDSLYGDGPQQQPQFYAADMVHLKEGTTAAADLPVVNQAALVDHVGFDLPRVGAGEDAVARRKPMIPDPRNDENLAVAQLHAAFIRFHNRAVDRLARESTTNLFDRARAFVTKHYQLMVLTDFLPRIVHASVLDDVLRNGRRFFEVGGGPRDGTMPIEFSVAAYRLGHSMVRRLYDWNAVFQRGGPQPIATLGMLFNFSGVSGTLSPADQSFERLPSNWIADWGRLFDLPAPLAAPTSRFNLSQRIGTLLADPLATLPAGAVRDFGGPIPTEKRMNLAYRNLMRGSMVRLPSGQQMATHFGVTPLTRQQILGEGRGAMLESDGLTPEEVDELARATPLWFYILREADASRDGRLGLVGSTIVAETFHRAIETSIHSVFADTAWRPELGNGRRTVTMADLLTFAFEGRRDLIAPLG